MSSNEEYLDQLLQSMEEEGADISDDGGDFSADIDAMYAELQLSGKLPGMDEEISTETNTVASSAEPSKQEESDSEDMSELLNSFDMSEIEEIPNAVESTPTAESMPTVESTQDMSQDEIESMLAAFADEEVPEAEMTEPVSGEDILMEDFSAESAHIEDALREIGFTEGLSEEEPSAEMPSEEMSSEEMPAMDKEEEDILALFDSIQDDESVGEINELLAKADNNEALDESVFAEEDAEAAAAEIAALLGEGSEGEVSQEEEGKPEKKKKEKKEKIKKEKVKKEKVKKEKVKKEQDGEEKAPKEPGFLGKLFSKLIEEDEPEPISEENQNIMKELEAEDAAEAGKEKKIKEGLMPGKEGGGEGDNSGKKGKKGSKPKKEKPKKEPKPKKAPKPKKEKPQKEPAAPEKPAKRISKASMIAILLFAGTVFAIVFFASTFLSGMLQKQRAKEAFAKQDYLSCYEELYGQNLSEEEEMMFHHARTVLKVERRLTRYENFLADYQIVEALDTLMQALVDYDKLYAEAQSYGAETEVNAYYSKIYTILERDYGLSRESAHAIAACDSKVDYTRYLTALAAGEQISINGSEGGFTLPEIEMQDVLPAEEEILPPAFTN